MPVITTVSKELGSSVSANIFKYCSSCTLKICLFIKRVFTHLNYSPNAFFASSIRGGASKAEVIISDDEINYPKIVNPDIVISLTQEAYNKYDQSLKI